MCLLLFCSVFVLHTLALPSYLVLVIFVGHFCCNAISMTARHMRGCTPCCHITLVLKHTCVTMQPGTMRTQQPLVDAACSRSNNYTCYCSGTRTLLHRQGGALCCFHYDAGILLRGLTLKYNCAVYHQSTQRKRVSHNYTCSSIHYSHMVSSLFVFNICISMWY
jgi:hypothetical protein